MPFAAVLDASVVYPLPLRDTLLRIAETELYDPYRSGRILDEVAAKNDLVDVQYELGGRTMVATGLDIVAPSE